VPARLTPPRSERARPRCQDDDRAAQGGADRHHGDQGRAGDHRAPIPEAGHDDAAWQVEEHRPQTAHRDDEGGRGNRGAAPAGKEGDDRKDGTFADREEEGRQVNAEGQ